MYVGRIVAVAKTKSGKTGAMYRVSSRSFPNREAKIIDTNVAILPKEGFEDDIKKNPFIAYNCLKTVNEYGIVSNGIHTDYITLNIEKGFPVRDALVTVLNSMDFEHDTRDTPRIAGVVNKISSKGFLGIVTKQSIYVKEFDLTDGDAYYVATYEHITPGSAQYDNSFDSDSAISTCRYSINGGVFANLEKPVTATALLENDTGDFEIATLNAD